MTQLEFDMAMRQINAEQTECNTIVNGRIAELQLKLQRIKLEVADKQREIQALHVQITELNQQKGAINAEYYQRKHKLIVENPKYETSREEAAASLNSIQKSDEL